MRVPPGAGSKVTVISVSWPRMPAASSQPQAELAVDALLDQAGALQHLQMPRYRRRRDVERFGDVADGLLALGEQALDDRAPGRIGEGGKDVIEVGRGGGHCLAH